MILLAANTVRPDRRPSSDVFDPSSVQTRARMVCNLKRHTFYKIFSFTNTARLCQDIDRLMPAWRSEKERLGDLANAKARS